MIQNFIIMICSFFIVYYVKKDHWILPSFYVEYLCSYVSVWVLSTILVRKLKLRRDSLPSELRYYLAVVILVTAIVSLITFALKWYDLSRFIIYGSIGLFFFLQTLALCLKYVRKEKGSPGALNPVLFFSELILIAASFFAIYYLKTKTFTPDDPYLVILVFFYFMWMIAGLATHRFTLRSSQNYFAAIWPFVKSELAIIAALSFFISFFRTLEFSRLVIFGTLSLFLFFELAFITLSFIYKKPAPSDEIETNLFNTKVENLPAEEIPIFFISDIEQKCVVNESFHSEIMARKMRDHYLHGFPAVFEYIEKNIELTSIDITKAEVIHTANPYNIQILPDGFFSFFLNLHEINDFRRINQYFIDVNQKLMEDGLLIGRFEPLENHYKNFISKYPPYMADLFYILHFIWKRIFPKLPFFQKLYFALSKGRDRVISTAEVLGRLNFCGYKILSMTEIENSYFFIARKINPPLNDTDPSYGPIFKMKRVGKDGRPIYVYKLRTMHPYSEYLQPFLTNILGYGANGKIRHDFRVTDWGKFFRKYWLDETPQLLNVLKGEMRFVGVRPLSERYLADYPEDVRRERMKYKPGCIPPYVGYNMQSFEKSIEAERIYFRNKEKWGILADVRILLSAPFVILFKKMRSQ